MYPGSVLAGTPPRPLSGSDSPPPLPTAWATTMKHQEDPEVRGPQRDWGDGRPRGHIVLTPPSLPEIILPWAAPDPQGARKCPPAARSPTAHRPQPHRPPPAASLPASCLPPPRWVPASPRSSMAAPCGSMLLSPGFTLAPGVGRGQAGSRSQGLPSLGQGSRLTSDPVLKLQISSWWWGPRKASTPSTCTNCMRTHWRR